MTYVYLRNTVLFLHILSVIMLLGGAMLSSLTFSMMKKTTKTKELDTLIRLAMRTPKLAAGGSILAILTGSLLVWIEGISIRTPWITSAYILWIASFLLSLTVMKPAMKKIVVILESALSKGKAESKELLTAITAPKIVFARRTLHVFAFLFLVLMVFKPGL